MGRMSFGEGDSGREGWTIPYDGAVPFFGRPSILASPSGTPPTCTTPAHRRRPSAGRSRSTPVARTSSLATKVYFPVHNGPGGTGLSRKAIMEQIDASLTRLGTDYIDLYQIHRFDPETPVEETMGALHDVVKAGKARYIGASVMWAWRFAKLQHTAESTVDAVRLHAGPVQPHQPRGGAGDVRPASRPGRRQHPVEPARQGVVTRPWGDRSTNRGASGTDRFGRPLWLDSDQAIIDAVQRIAEARRVSMAQVAMAWVLKNPVVDARSSAPPSSTTWPTPPPRST